jgi:tetratricopeptide (TPR) repeat protein
LLCLLLLAGCSSSAPRQSPSPVVEHGQPLPDVDSRVTYQAPAASAAGGQVAAAGATQLPAVVALLEQAEQQANAGELEAAAASLERAIRIDARNPVIWYHLATVRLSQGEPAQAAQLAGKSNSLAPGNTAQQARNWLLIAEARRQLNDRSGAAAAERLARELAAR